jgi:signal transduction histidine kinase
MASRTGSSSAIRRAGRCGWQNPRLGDGSVLESIGGELLTYLLLAFPLVLLPLWLAVRRGLRPLHQLTQRIAARAPDDLSPIGHDLKYVELQPLMAAFENMLVQLRGKVRRERAFVQDAAHELRTPMAVITAQAHVLIARSVDSRTCASRRRFISNEAIARASHVAGQLLELATLDETHPRELSSFDVAHHLRHAAGAKSGACHRARNIDLSLDAPDTLHWPLDLAAFQSVIHNLLDNALRFVHEGCRITVAAGTAGGTLDAIGCRRWPRHRRGIARTRVRAFLPRQRQYGARIGPWAWRLSARRCAAWAARYGLQPGLDQRGCTFHVQLGAA